MSQLGVIYATKTKHSQKLAEAIGQAVHVKAENVTASPTPFPADLLFIVGGIYAGKSLPELINYVENLKANQVKKVVLVTSSVSTSKRRQSDTRRILKKIGIEVLEEITCPGSLLFVKSGHPNTMDIKMIADRAKQIAEQI
jgi:hypothetical protein